ncbi:MAG TPA: cell division protein SepF [Acidothermaceae bacterium]|jgi:cell division inhibitor SepF
MAFMRKAAVYLGLVEDGEQYDEQYDAYDEYESQAAPAPAARSGRRGGAGAHDTAVDLDYGRRGPDHRLDQREGRHDARDRSAGYPASRSALATAPAPTPTRLGWSDGVPSVRVTTLHPRTYNEARAIGEHFREGTPVIMNLTEMDDADAKRLVDFAAGLIFGLHGSIDRVTAKVFLLSPHNVEVTAEDKQRLAEGGFFNQS